MPDSRSARRAELDSASSDVISLSGVTAAHGPGAEVSQSSWSRQSGAWGGHRPELYDSGHLPDTHAGDYEARSDFLSFSHSSNFALVPSVAVSTDGGLTWTPNHVAPPVTSVPQGFRQACTVRTASHGTVYPSFTHFSNTSNNGAQTMVTSSTGGATWDRPVDIMQMNAACFFFDPVAGRCNMEGPAGARNDLMAMPSVDIANGAAVILWDSETWRLLSARQVSLARDAGALLELSAALNALSVL